MSIYDRQYMRYDFRPNRSDPLVWMLGAMLLAYLAQVFGMLFFKSDVVSGLFALSTPALMHGRVWTLLTYAFLHGGPLHLLINMLIIYMVGRIVQRDIGQKRFLLISGYSVLGGAVFFMVFHMGPGATQLVGASAMAMGLLTVYCLLRPDEPVTFLLFFVFPVQLRPRTLLIGMAFVEFVMLTAELQGLSGVASSAHLGGMGAAFIYHRRMMGLPFFPKGESRRKSKNAEKRSHAPKYTVNITNRSELSGEVDRILDKINSQGFGSLTDDEKALLDRAKDILNNQNK